MNFKLLLFIKFKHVTLYLGYQKYDLLFFPLLVYLEVYLVGAAGVETTFWVIKLRK